MFDLGSIFIRQWVPTYVLPLDAECWRCVLHFLPRSRPALCELRGNAGCHLTEKVCHRASCEIIYTHGDFFSFTFLAEKMKLSSAQTVKEFSFWSYVSATPGETRVERVNSEKILIIRLKYSDAHMLRWDVFPKLTRKSDFLPCTLKVSTCQQTDSLDFSILFSLFLRVAVDLKRGLTDYMKV